MVNTTTSTDTDMPVNFGMSALEWINGFRTRLKNAGFDNHKAIEDKLSALEKDVIRLFYSQKDHKK